MNKLLLALAITCFSTGLINSSPQTAAAENWLKLYQGETDTLYFDSDSYAYDPVSNTITFWDKYLDPQRDTHIQTHRCYSYNDKSFASLAINTYNKGQLSSSYVYPEAEYEPILPNTLGENNYNFFAYVNNLQQQGIDWTFNKVFIASPAKLSSSSWIVKPDLPQVYYDTSSYRYDKESNTETFWVRSSTQLDGISCTKLTYYLHNLNNDHFAWVASESFVEGSLTTKTIYPILIWHRPEVIRRDAYAPSVDSFNQGLLILNRVIENSTQRK